MSSQPGVTSYKRSEPDPPEIAKMRTEASAEVAELWSSDVTDAFLIIACDGIFEEIDNKQAVALARAAFHSNLARRSIHSTIVSFARSNTPHRALESSRSGERENRPGWPSLLSLDHPKLTAL